MWDKKTIDEEVVRKELIQRFPWIEKEISHSGGEGLIHVELALLRSCAEEYTKQKNIKRLADIFGFIESLLSQKRSLHPDVLNAIEISFVEDLILAEHPIYEDAKLHMPQQLSSLAKEIEKQV
jgi:hypothetical protein